jgi:Rieske Fe-S protein
MVWRGLGLTRRPAMHWSRSRTGVFYRHRYRCGRHDLWNDADHTWDCAYHGSRFAPDGTLLAVPAVHSLKPIDHG